MERERDEKRILRCNEKAHKFQQKQSLNEPRKRKPNTKYEDSGEDVEDEGDQCKPITPPPAKKTISLRLDFHKQKQTYTLLTNLKSAILDGQCPY